MQSAPIPPNESQRLAALASYQLLDTLPEEVYDDITKIASELCGTPIAMLSLIDKDRHWAKSRQGVEITEFSRDLSFCAHAIINPDTPMVVEDLRYDERFHDHPFVTGTSNILFYAGVPVVDTDGFALGTICVLDHRPRALPEEKLAALKALAKLVQAHLSLRKVTLELTQTKADLDQARNALAQIKL
jgi:hypothetical protein